MAVIEHLGAFVSRHAEVIGLLGLAFVVTMRDELPAPFNRVALLVWCYGWLHDALKTFVSFRGPSKPAEPRPAARPEGAA